MARPRSSPSRRTPMKPVPSPGRSSRRAAAPEPRRAATVAPPGGPSRPPESAGSPGDGFVALREGKVPDLAGCHPPEQRGHVLHPVDVGDKGDALPRPQVLGDQLEVLPTGTARHAEELRTADRTT